MRGKTITIIILSVVLIGVLGLCGLTAYGAYHWTRANGVKFVSIGSTTASGEVTETRTFSVDQPVTLDVNTDLGDVSVTAEEGATQVSVEIVKKAWGKDEAEAQALAKDLPVEISQAGGKLTLHYNNQPQNRVVLMGNDRPPSVSFHIKTPVRTAATITTHNGELDLTGTQGDANLDCLFGKLTVKDVQGGLVLNGTNTTVTVQNVQAGPAKISLSNSFGTVQFSDSAGGDILVQNGNGDITLSGVEASGSLTVTDSFGKVGLNGFKADALSITSQNGDVNVRAGQVNGLLQVEGSFGKIDVANTPAADYTLHGQNGAITLAGARGKLDLDTSFGDVTVSQAENAALAVNVQNGKFIFSGTLDPQAGQSVETAFGDVTLNLPAASAYKLELESGMGKVKSDLPVTVSGEVGEDKLNGTLNGGGPLLSVKVQNGNINLLVLK